MPHFLWPACHPAPRTREPGGPYDPRAAICVDLEQPPFAYVQVQGIAELSEDPADLAVTATAIGTRYMGADRAEEFGRRNGVPGELVVRVRPVKVIADFDVTG